MARMKQLAIATAVLLTGAAPSAAFAQTDLPSITQNRSTLDAKLDQQFKSMDAGHDGRVSKSEFDTYWQHQLRLSDTNHDGRISQAEARAAAKRLNGGKLPRKNRFDLQWNSISHHGVLDEQQALAWHERLFRQADADGNGELSKGEMRQALSANNWNVGSL
ncbi:MAG: EF-hand domain-containing protein [Rhodanobacteraceae bacterium]